MRSLDFLLSGLHGPRDKAPEAGIKGSRELQTVQEADYERPTLLTDVPNGEGPSPTGRPSLEPNPSQRPLGRIAHADAFTRQNEVAKRSVYAQEGDEQPSEFKETVAELLREEEYGLFRLVVPSVELGRREFDEYVAWLNKKERLMRRSVYGLPVIRPFSTVALFWTCLMTVVDVTWTAFGVPINVAFCSVNYGRLSSGCTGSDLTFGVVYALNLFISFNLGVVVVNGHRKKEVTDGRRVAWYYMRYGRFVLDVAATVPFVYLVTVLTLSNGQGYRAKWVNAVSLIRLIRLLRIVSVSKVIYIDAALGPDGWLSRYMRVSTLYVLMIAFQIVVLINLFACLLLLLANMHGREESWMTAVSWTDLPEASRAYQWYCAVYWVITTTTTTGFGDISPRWWGEQVVIGMAMVGGMIAFGILVGSVANALARADTNASRLQSHIKKISQVNKWLATSRGLDDKIKKKVQEHFAQLYVAKQSVQYGEAELFADLPPYLRFEVAGGLALPLVRRVHAFAKLNSGAQQLIASQMRPLRAIVGQELCRQGDEADRLWLLASGRLVALRHKEEPLHVSAPALVGESLVLAIDIPQCRHRPWTLRAALPCQLWEMRLEDLSRVIQIYPAVRLSLLEHVRTDLLRALFQSETDLEPHEAAPAQDWCELTALLHRTLLELQEVDPGALDRLSNELAQASIEDGSLQARLTEIVDAAMVRDGLAPEALLGLPLPVQREAAAAAQQQQLQCQASALGAERPSAGGGNGGGGNGNGNGRQRSGVGGSLWPRGSAGGSALLRRGASGTAATAAAAGKGALHHANGQVLAAMMAMQQQQHADPHHGPAPWGLTTEDVLGAGGVSWGNPQSLHQQPLPPPPPPLPLHQQQLQFPPREPHQQLQQPAPSSLPLKLQKEKENSRSWHGRASPPRPPRGFMLPMPPHQQQQMGQQLTAGRSFRRVASHHQNLQAASSGGGGSFVAAAGGSDLEGDSPEAKMSGLATPPQGGISRQPTASSPALDLSPAAGGGGTLKSPWAAAPPPVPWPPEIGDDPIAEETGVLSPAAQQWLQDHVRQQQLQPPQEGGSGLLGDAAAPVPPGGSLGAAGTAAASGSGVPLRRMSGPTGPAAPMVVAGPAVVRRSMLSRMSSPFAAQMPASVAAGITAPAGPAAAAGAGGDGPGSAEAQTGRGGGLNGSCATCGVHHCPQCGALVPHPAPPPLYNHHLTALHVQTGGGAAAAAALPPAAGSATAMSLLDAIRGGGAAAAAAGGGGGLLRRSAAPWATQQVGSAPPSPRHAFWGPAAAGSGGVAPGSPTAALSRRSRMFGRSFAATARADSLVRNTLRRDTIWNAYSAQDEEELGSPSMPARADE